MDQWPRGQPQRCLLLAVACTAGVRGASCPGSFQVPGVGHVFLVPTGWKDPSAAKVEVQGKQLVAHMDARAYFAEACTAGVYNPTQYVGIDLLGKTLRYTVDLTGAGCGCNAAFYLTSMRQNKNPSDCSDYYCDANNVCGESCAEIDIQEANQHAWHSTLHTRTDRFGVGGGYGGGDGYNGARDWGSAQYGPGASCVDTTLPFQVSATFPVDAQGNLVAMKVELSQQGKSCTVSTNVGSYGGMGELSAAFKAGMTPIISYWSDNGMLWMDGKGMDGQGPCVVDDAAACSRTVKFSDFSLQPIGGQPAPTLPPPAPQAPPAPPAPAGTSQAPPAPVPAAVPAPAATPQPVAVPPQPVTPSVTQQPRPTVPPAAPQPPPANPLPPQPPPPSPVPAIPTPSPPPSGLLPTMPPTPPPPAPVPIPVPVPFPSDAKGKVAIFQALGALCGTGSTVHRIGSTLTGYILTCIDRLHTSPYQGCIAMSATLLGLTSAYDGPFLYRTLFIIVAAVVMASIGDYEVRSLELAQDQVSRGFIVFEVMIAMGLATHFGFDGSQVLFGIALGLCGAHGCSSFVLQANEKLHGFAVMWYSLGALFGGLIFTIWRSFLLKTLAPLVGGFLVTTGFGAALSRLWFGLGFPPAPFLPSPHIDWASSALVLMGLRGRGAVAGGVACSLVSLAFIGFGGSRRIFAVPVLLSYILVNGILGIVLEGRENWLWPFSGCLLWALATGLAAWRQMELTDSAEIQGCFKDAMSTAMSTRLLSMSRTDMENPFETRRSSGGESAGGGISALGSPYRPVEPSAPPRELGRTPREARAGQKRRG